MENQDWLQGTLRDFIGRPGSGIALIRIERPDGSIDEVPCENGPTVRALREMFGSIQTSLDQPIEYALGDYELLGWIRRSQEVS